MPKLFVYGSLKTDGEFFHIIEQHVRSIVLRNACVYGKLVKMDDYPVLVPNEHSDKQIVYGELLEISHEGLRHCDSIECYYTNNLLESLYVRSPIDVYDSFMHKVCVGLTYVGSLGGRCFWWDNNLKEIKMTERR
jgi:gamma-glutamylcyclotransferase (GGCT)/AIG2-like uncharacterized protein YtfP